MKFLFYLVVLWQFQTHIVTLPVPTYFDELKAIVITLIFSALNPQVWIVGLTIAIVASIETLLCIEAADRMDHKGILILMLS
jgi:MFS superfamily sulfate permease-like transporter